MSPTSIAVIDSGVANLRSVANALQHLGASFWIAESPADLVKADKIILPGVGAFEAGMRQVQAKGFIAPLHDYAAKGTPILGICLGMQLLFERSEEMGDHEGIGLLPGAVLRFPANGPKVPHIGWNQLEHDGSSPLLKGVPAGAYAYFVHSYYVATTQRSLVLASACYGIDFPAVVGRGNVFGAQFHPEKSHHSGLTLLKNFMAL
jgi:glutamine amidotransferase